MHGAESVHRRAGAGAVQRLDRFRPGRSPFTASAYASPRLAHHHEPEHARINAIVRSGRATTIVTPWSPRMATSAATSAAGPRRAASRPPATSSNISPERSVKRDRLLAEPRRLIRHRDSARREPPAPEVERPGGHGERRDVICPAPFGPDRHAPALVGERRPDRPRRAGLVAVVEVVDAVVVEVDGLLDEPEAERADGRSRGPPGHRRRWR